MKKIMFVLLFLVSICTPFNFSWANEQKEISFIEKPAITVYNTPVYIPKEWGNLVWVGYIGAIGGGVKELYFQDTGGTIRIIQCTNGGADSKFFATKNKENLEIQFLSLPRK